MAASYFKMLQKDELIKQRNEQDKGKQEIKLMDLINLILEDQELFKFIMQRIGADKSKGKDKSIGKNKIFLNYIVNLLQGEQDQNQSRKEEEFILNLFLLNEIYAYNYAKDKEKLREVGDENLNNMEIYDEFRRKYNIKSPTVKGNHSAKPHTPEAPKGNDSAKLQKPEASNGNAVAPNMPDTAKPYPGFNWKKPTVKFEIAPRSSEHVIEVRNSSAEHVIDVRDSTDSQGRKPDKKESKRVTTDSRSIWS